MHCESEQIINVQCDSYSINIYYVRKYLGKKMAQQWTRLVSIALQEEECTNQGPKIKGKILVSLSEMTNLQIELIVDVTASTLKISVKLRFFGGWFWGNHIQCLWQYLVFERFVPMWV